MLYHLSIIFFSFLPLFYSFTLVAWEREWSECVTQIKDGWMDGWRAEGSDSINQSKQASNPFVIGSEGRRERGL